MTEPPMTEPPMSNQGKMAAPNRGAAPEPPLPEREQPDPMLQMSTGRSGAVAFTLVALVIAAILAVTLWGLNSPGPARHTAAASSAAPSKEPAAGGKPGAAATPGAPRTTRSGNG
jgi:hypothetical protein